jgi:hypothetical protein
MLKEIFVGSSTVTSSHQIAKTQNAYSGVIKRPTLPGHTDQAIDARAAPA